MELENKKNKKWPRKAFTFFLRIVGVVFFGVGIVDVVDVVELDVVVDVVGDVVHKLDGLIIRNVCLMKPNDGEVLVKNHRANKKILVEDAAATFDANFSAVVANARAAPVERAVVLYAPHNAFVAIRVEVESAKIIVRVRIPMPTVGIDDRLNRCSDGCSRVVPSDRKDFVVVHLLVVHGVRC